MQMGGSVERHKRKPAVGWELILVLAVSAAALLPGVGLPGLGGLPVVDRDEARFAQASRQMLESSTLEGWIVPRVGDRPRLNKPPLIYWMQSGVAWVATGGDPSMDRIWMYRLPSVLAALFAAGLTWWLGRRMFGRGPGILAGIMLGTCPLVVFDAHQARADEVLLAITLAAQAALWWCWSARDRPGGPPFSATFLLWFCVAMGIMTKGPITPFVTGATAITMAVIDRRWRWLWQLRPWLGLLVIMVMVIPWIWLVASSVGWQAIERFIDEEIIRRASSGVEGHWGPPGYHLVLLVVLFWPGSLLITAAVVHAVRQGLRRESIGGGGGRLRRLVSTFRHLRGGRDAEFFLLAWLIPAWVAFELAGTKLPHYVLPLYPSVALLVGSALFLGIRNLPEAQGAMARAGFRLWLVLGIGFALAPVGMVVLADTAGWWHLEDSTSAWWPLSAISPMVVRLVAIIGAAVGIAAVVIGFIHLRRGDAIRAVVWPLLTVVITQSVLLAFVLPRVSHLWISPRLLALVEHDSGSTVSSADFPALGSNGFGEDSLVYLSRTRMQLVTDTLAFLEANPTGYIIVHAADADSIIEQTDVRVVGKVSGFGYSGGDHYELVVLTRRPVSAQLLPNTRAFSSTRVVH